MCERQGFHSSGYENYPLTSCNPVLPDRNIPAFPENVVPPISGCILQGHLSFRRYCSMKSS